MVSFAKDSIAERNYLIVSMLVLFGSELVMFSKVILLKVLLPSGTTIVIVVEAECVFIKDLHMRLSLSTALTIRALNACPAIDTFTLIGA